jgi:hypothetical protein
MFLAYNYLCLRKYEKSILFLINYSNWMMNIISKNILS